MSEAITPQPTKTCLDCGRPIPLAARKCGNDQCGAYQDWRRFTGGPISLVTTATSLGVLLSLILNIYQIRDLANKPSKEEATEIAKTSAEESLRHLSQSLRSEESKLLAVPDEWQARYESFLKDPETGIIKLLPRGKYAELMKMNGGGAYYSFVHRTHEYGRGSDIELQNNELQVGFGGLDYGFFVPLGSFAIQDVAADPVVPTWVSPETRAAWTYAWTYSPPPLVRDLRCEQRQFGDGRAAGGINLIDKVPVQEGHAYLLRSISPRHSDVLVGLRVEKKLSDGSYVIVWRKLKAFSVPRTEGPEPERDKVCEGRATG